MPELPEVETVRRTLLTKLKKRKIVDVEILYPKLIEYPSPNDFANKIVNQTINDIERRGKWLMFKLDDYYLLSHLRMEGKYYFRCNGDKLGKHECVAFKLDNDEELRYNDTRKFGRMHLIPIDDVYNQKPLNELGLEPWDEKLTSTYLLEKYKNKKIPIKTVILDQSIITGIGNIYADEILFLSKISPLKVTSILNKEECEAIIKNTRHVLEQAIKKGGTTIRSYESSEGVHGKFQSELLVHGKKGEKCPICDLEIIKIKINGRGTYYCTNCQR